MAGLRNGAVALTQTVKHICRILTKWHPAISAVITAAVGSGAITSAQASTLEAWLSAADDACSILRLITKY